MAVKECTIRVKGLDQPWSTVGAGMAQGIWPQNIVLSADRWGPKTASFELRRKAGVNWPDIRALSPIEISVGGKLVWSGRILEGPEREGEEDVISVQCEGWQHHLDDDVSERYFIQRGPSRWKDFREIFTSTLGAGEHIAAAQVSVGEGITLQMPQDLSYSAGDKCSVVIDAGENQTIQRFLIAGATSNNNNGTPQVRFLVCSSDDLLGPGKGSSADVYGAFALTTLGASFTGDVTLPTPRRYLYLTLLWQTAGVPASNDSWVRVTDIQVYADSTHVTSSSSNLLTDTVLKAAASDTTALLSSSYDRVQGGSYVLQDWAPTEPRTGRELVEALNAFEDRKVQVDVDKRVVFEAKQTVPKIEVGEWSPMSFEDASANSSADVYSRVILQGVDTSGRPLNVIRTQSQQPDTPLIPATSQTLGNPDFETNTSYWSANGASSVLTRQSTVVLAGSWSGKWDDGAGGGPSQFSSLLYGLSGSAFSGTFLAGVTYGIKFATRCPASTAKASFGSTTFGSIEFTTTHPTASTQTVMWTPSVDTPGSSVIFGLQLTNALTSALYIDDLALYTSVPTIIERSNFQRTKVISTSFAGTQESYARIGDLWLQNHRKVPFRGSANLVGNSAVRDIKSGSPVAPETLLLHTDSLLRFSHRVDPDTGEAGRDGRIADVTYTLDTDSAQVSIDSSRSNFEAFMARVGSVLSSNGL